MWLAAGGRACKRARIGAGEHKVRRHYFVFNRTSAIAASFKSTHRLDALGGIPAEAFAQRQQNHSDRVTAESFGGRASEIIDPSRIIRTEVAEKSDRATAELFGDRASEIIASHPQQNHPDTLVFRPQVLLSTHHQPVCVCAATCTTA